MIMKKQIESMYIFQGKNDYEKVWVQEQEISSDNYNLPLIGKVKYVSQKDEEFPVLSFPFFPQSSVDRYEDMYLCGGYYFKRDNSFIKPIGYLSSYFGTEVTDVSFAGYLVHPQHKILGIIAIGKDMYMSDSTQTYHNIGKKDDYIPSNIISIYFNKTHYVAITNQNKAYVANVTYNDIHPTIQISQEEEKFETIVKLLNPTCCGLLLSNNKYKYIFFNKSGGYIEIDEWKSPTIKQSGEINLNFDYFHSSIGTHFDYLIFDNIDGSNIALEKRETKVVDMVCNFIEKSYNEKRQVLRLDNYNSAWNETLQGVVNNYIDSTKYYYFWNSFSEYAPIARNAVGVLEEVIREYTDVSGIIFQQENLHANYKIKTDKDGDKRIIYDSIQTKSGLENSNDIILNQVMSYSQSGQPVWIAGVETANKDKYRTYSQMFYSKENPELLIASFDAVTCNNEGKYSAGYTGFELYEEMRVEGEHLVTPHFIFSRSNFSVRVPWGSQSLYFDNNGTISLSDSVYIDSQPDSKYVIMLLLLEESKSKWEVRSIFKNSEDFLVSKEIATIKAGTYVASVLFKNVSCESNVYLYNPETHKKYGHIDNNFVPDFSVFNNETGKILFSYKLRMDDNNGIKIIGNKIIMNQIKLFGYALFGGYNKLIEPQIQKSEHNTILQLRFRNDGRILEYGEMHVLSSPEPKPFILLGHGNLSLELFALKTGQENTVVNLEAEMISIKICAYQLTISQGNTIDKVMLNDKLNKDFNWILGVQNNVIFIFINGKLIYSSVLNCGIFVTLRAYEKQLIHEQYRKVIIIEDFDIIISYYDYLGRIVQTQTLKSMYDSLSRIVTSMYFYNSSNQLIAQTLKGAYPYDKKAKLNKTDSILKYRSNFARIDWNAKKLNDERGILDGELASYYKDGEGKSVCISPEDYKYPYTYCEYETGGLLRLKRICQPGKNGFETKEDIYFHDSETYDKIIKEYYPFDADYNASIGTEVVNEKVVSMFDRRAFQYNGTEFLTSFNTSMNEKDVITSKVSSKIELNDAFKSNLVVNGNSYYQNININEKMMSQYNFAFNRVQVYWGIDTGYNIQINDAAGRGRLVLHDIEIAGSLAIYFKYDRRSRIIETGRITLSAMDTIEKLLEYVLDPEFPSDNISTSHTKTAIYKYDLEGFGYSLGRLCYMSMFGFKHDVEYYYDQFGRVNKQHITAINFHLEENFMRDNLFNLLSIKYVRERGESITIYYSYIGNNANKIRYVDELGGEKIILLSQEYDIYNRLLVYQDCNGNTMFNKYDFLGRLISMGRREANNSETSVSKNYSKNAMKYQRLYSLEYRPNESFRKFEYDDFLRLKSVKDSITDIVYDKNGNLLSYNDSGKQNIISYEGICKVSGTPTVNYKYNKHGMVTEKNMGEKKLEIIMDFEFPAKIQTLTQKDKIGNTEAIYDIQYDAASRVALTVYAVIDAGINMSEIFSYAEDGRTLQSKILNGSEHRYMTYVYLGSRLIAMVNSNGEFYGLSQDESKTLYVYTSKNEVKTIEYSAWGIPEVDTKIHYLYKGMLFLDQWNLYINNGSIYDPTIGITFVPILESESYTPYRIIDNVPFG